MNNESSAPLLTKISAAVIAFIAFALIFLILGSFLEGGVPDTFSSVTPIDTGNSSLTIAFLVSLFVAYQIYSKLSEPWTNKESKPASKRKDNGHTAPTWVKVIAIGGSILLIVLPMIFG